MKWTELIGNLFELFGTNQINSMLSSLKILEIILQQTKNKLVPFSE